MTDFNACLRNRVHSGAFSNAGILGCAISIVWFPLLTLYLCLQTIGISLDCLVIHPMQRAFWMIMCRGALKMEASGMGMVRQNQYIYIYLSLIDPVIICYIYNWNCTGKYGPGLWSCLQNLLFTCFFTSCVQLFNRLFLDGKSFSKPISHGRGYVPWKEWFFPELPDINIPILVVVNAYIRVIRDNHQYVASIHLLGFYIARPGEEEGPREIPRPSLKLEQLRQFGRWALVV